MKEFCVAGDLKAGCKQNINLEITTDDDSQGQIDVPKLKVHMTKFGRVESILQKMKARINQLDEEKVVMLQENWFRKDYYKAAFYKSSINMYKEETQEKQL